MRLIWPIWFLSETVWFDIPVALAWTAIALFLFYISYLALKYFGKGIP